MIGVDLVPRFVEAANLELEDWCLAHCRKAFSWLKLSDGEKKVMDEPVVLSAMMSGIEKEEKLKGMESVLAGNLLKERELGIASEMLDQYVLSLFSYSRSFLPSFPCLVYLFTIQTHHPMIQPVH